MKRALKMAAATVLALAGCSGSDEAALREMYPPLGAFVEVEGLDIHYVEAGEGPAVILIHGASGNLRDWTFSMVDRLKGRYRVIAFDRPGFGYSERPAEGGHIPATQARILSEAARALGVGRALVVGHSWGGAVAAAWGLDHPEQAAGVAIIAGATYPWDGDAGLLYRLGDNAITGGLIGAIARGYIGDDNRDEVIAGIFAPQPAPDGYADYIGIELAVRPATFDANSADLNRLNDVLKEQSKRYPGLAMPIEIVHGTDDDTVYANLHGKALERDAQDAALTLLDGIGHMPHHVAQDEVVAAIDRLAARVFGSETVDGGEAGGGEGG